MPRNLAGALVFGSSAAVLVIEILAGRLLAPYVGITLETFTAIIGTALAGIAVGTWMGGKVADRVDPHHLLGPELVAGGVLTMAVVPIVRAVGPAVAGSGAVGVTVLALLAIFAPAAVLSAVTPAVVKAVLADLNETGRVVGWLSGLGTAGAIAATFVTGFVLVAALATPTILFAVGVVCTGAGVALWWALRERPTASLGGLLVIGAIGGWATLGLAGPCDLETAYYCARIRVDPDRASGRILQLDNLDHSYVDVEDPGHLEFDYTKLFAAVVDAAAAPGPLDTVHIGGGAFTMPRWLASTRPGSTSVVLEIDPELVSFVDEELGLPLGDGLRIVTGDARLSLAELDPDSAEVVVGDAFGGVAVPWHLATVEFTRQIADVLRPSGVYVANVIDFPTPDARFLRAELATLAEVFPHVAVVSTPERFDDGGNFVAVGSFSPVPAAAVADEAAAAGLEVRVVTGGELEELVDGARPLTDDFAPVDQLLQYG